MGATERCLAMRRFATCLVALQWGRRLGATESGLRSVSLTLHLQASMGPSLGSDGKEPTVHLPALLEPMGFNGAVARERRIGM